MTVPQAKAAGVGWYRTRHLDEVAVFRATGGERLRLTKAERDAVIDHFDRQGLPAAEIAHRIGCSQRTVCRRRAERVATGGPAPAITVGVGQVGVQVAVLDEIGMTGPQVAMVLGISVSTVYYHRTKRAAQQERQAA